MLPKMGYKNWRCKNAMGVAIHYGLDNIELLGVPKPLRINF